MPAPRQRVPRHQLDLLTHNLACLIDVAPDVPSGDIDVDVAREEPVLVAEHGRPLHDLDVGELGQRYLCPGRSRDEHAAQPIDIVAQLAGITHVDRIALAPFDGRCDVLASNRAHDHRLDLGYGQAVSRDLIAPRLEVDEVAACGSLRVDAARAFDPIERAFDLHAHALDLLRIGAEDLDANRRTHAGGEHVNSALDGLGPGVGHTGDLERPIHLIDQLLPGQVVGLNRPEWRLQPSGPARVEPILVSPLLRGLEDHRGLHHGKRSRIGRGVRASSLAEHPLYLGEAFQHLVLRGHQLLRGRHRNARHRRRHVQNRALVQGRHELAPELEVRGKAQSNDRHGGQNHGLGVPEHKAAHGFIDAEDRSADRVLLLGMIGADRDPGSEPR